MFKATSVMKKVIHYMQEQAVHPSATAAYLQPPGREPQQRGHHSPYGSNHHTPSSSAAPSRTGSPRPHSKSKSFPLPSDVTKHQYASDNILQSYTVYVPPLDASHLSGLDSPKYFLVYVHGGYYRDPKVNATSFDHTLSLLVNSPLYSRTRTHISGYASINYRLSPHPDYPQDPHRTSDYELRNATHTEHIEDVVTAIADLQRRYGFGSRYILMGHSVGATLALQAAICGQVPWAPHSKTDVAGEPVVRISPPTAIIGFNGIYSFPLIHSTNPSYEALTSNALSADPEVHKAASPATYPPSAFVGSSSHHPLRHIVLAASRADKKVPWSQVECMRDAFSEDGETDLEVRVVEIKGDHNESWEKGEDMCKVVGLTLKAIAGSGT